MLENISDIIGCLCLTSIGLVFGYLLSNEKFTKKKIAITIIIIIAYSIGYNFIYYNVGNSMRGIINFAINTLIFKFLFNFKLFKAIFVSFLHSILLLASEMLCLIILFFFTNINNGYIYNIMAGGIIGNVLVCTVFIFLAIALRKPLKKLLSSRVTQNTRIITYIILTICCIAFFFFFAITGMNNSNTKSFFIGSFAIIVFITILFSFIKQNIKNERLTKEYDNLIDFVKEYEMIIENQRIDRHENKNTLVNIKSKLIDKSKRNDIIEYIDSILKEKTTFSKEKYAKLGYLPSNGLKGLFYYKIDRAENMGIKVSISIPKDVSKSLLYDLKGNDYKELCKIIGVYLDNAIEASIISDDKNIGIEIYNRQDYVSVIISNSYCGEIDEVSINKTGYSTKGSGRGYGLSLVNKIIKSNPIFENETNVTPKLYIQKLTIKKSIND